MTSVEMTAWKIPNAFQEKTEIHIRADALMGMTKKAINVKRTKETTVRV